MCAKRAVVIDGRINGQPVLQAELIIFHAVAGCDVDESGAGGALDKRIAGVEFAGAIAERMLILDLLEMIGIECADDFVIIPMRFFGDGFQQARSKR